MDRKLKWRNSIAARLLVKVFQYYIFITVVVTLVHMAADFSFTQGIISEDLTIFHTSFEPGLSIALWNQEEEAIEASLLAIEKVPQIVGAKVLSPERQQISAIGHVEDSEGKNVLYSKNLEKVVSRPALADSGLFSFEKDIVYRDEGEEYTVGKLVLFSSRSIVFNQVKAGYIFIIVNSIIKTVALWIIVLWQAKPLIYDPLKIISEKLRSRQLDNIDEFKFDVGDRWNSELDMLKTSFNSMTDVLSSSVREKNKAQKVAELANKAKSDFLAKMSHELRTPLNAILGFSDLMIEDARDKNLGRFEADAKRVKRAGTHLLRLVNDLLDFSKMESGKFTYRISDCQLRPELMELGKYGRLLAKKRGNRFEMFVGEQVDQIEVDLARLRQVLLNLLGNAAKFTEEGLITLRVDLEPTSLGGEYVFTVSDTGTGMDQEQVDQLFKEFVQFHGDSRDSLSGTGLGLAITKEIVEALSGTIEVRSEVGRGTDFVVRLPKHQIRPDKTESGGENENSTHC